LFDLFAGKDEVNIRPATYMARILGTPQIVSPVHPILYPEPIYQYSR
jgi:hypothetical protein